MADKAIKPVYEYPLGSKPSKEEQALFEDLADIAGGKQKNYLLAYLDKKGVLQVRSNGSEDDLIHVASRAISFLNEKRRNRKSEDDGA